MNDRLEQARRLGRRIDAGWQPADIEAQLARLHARRGRRARRWAAGAQLVAAAITAAILAGVTGVTRVRTPARADSPEPRPAAVHPAPPAPAVAAPAVRSAPAVEAPAPAPGTLSLGDGSVVTPLGKDSRLLARRVSETDVVVALAGGGARFEVPERKARRFRAELGALALETHGAAFRVQVGRRQVEVVAERGEVSARMGPEAHVVAAGETRAFSIAIAGAGASAGTGAGAIAGAGEAREDAAMAGREPAATEPPISWREAAGRGDYAAAWAALAALRSPVDGMEDLLLAGDVARLSGHPGAAVAPLTRAAELHAEDPRAPLAAFTLGRVHLEDLGAPRDAALAFARARLLAPDGPLAEDALAREVEAWSRAGETETARARALTYTRRYPQGRRVHAVRRFGGLESP